MTSDSSSDRQVADQREWPAEIPSPARPSRQSSPPIPNDGPELLRDSHC